jgi:hypothetical protein
MKIWNFCLQLTLPYMPLPFMRALWNSHLCENFPVPSIAYTGESTVFFLWLTLVNIYATFSECLRRRSQKLNFIQALFYMEKIQIKKYSEFYIPKTAALNIQMHPFISSKTIK